MFLGRADHLVPAGQLRPSDVPSKVLKTLFQKSWVDKLSQWPSLGRCQLDQSWVQLLGEGKRRTTKPKLEFVFSPEPVQETPPKRNGVTRGKKKGSSWWFPHQSGMEEVQRGRRETLHRPVCFLMGGRGRFPGAGQQGGLVGGLVPFGVSLQGSCQGLSEEEARLARPGPFTVEVLLQRGGAGGRTGPGRGGTGLLPGPSRVPLGCSYCKGACRGRGPPLAG